MGVDRKDIAFELVPQLSIILYRYKKNCDVIP